MKHIIAKFIGSLFSRTQGSILGTVLLNNFVNDLEKAVCALIKLADNSNLGDAQVKEDFGKPEEQANRNEIHPGQMQI